jgi:hypothetical protein
MTVVRASLDVSLPKSLVGRSSRLGGASVTVGEICEKGVVGRTISDAPTDPTREAVEFVGPSRLERLFVYVLDAAHFATRPA